MCLVCVCVDRASYCLLLAIHLSSHVCSRPRTRVRRSLGSSPGGLTRTSRFRRSPLCCYFYIIVYDSRLKQLPMSIMFGTHSVMMRDLDGPCCFPLAFTIVRLRVLEVQLAVSPVPGRLPPPFRLFIHTPTSHDHLEGLTHTGIPNPCSVVSQSHFLSPALCVA